MQVLAHLIVLAWLISSSFFWSATAQETETATCPENASTLMLQVTWQIPEATDDNQINNAYSYADRLPKVCPEDPYVHYFAATALTQIMQKVDDPNVQLGLLSQATQTFTAFDALLPDEGAAPLQTSLTNADGSPFIVDVERDSYRFMSETLGPLVVRYEASGLFHAWVKRDSRIPEAPCPYKDQTYAAREAAGHAEGHRQVSPQILDNGGRPNPLGSIQRIKWLKERCPEAETALVYQLAGMYTDAARWWDAKHGESEPNNWAANAKDHIQSYLDLTAETPEDYTTTRRLADQWLSEMQELAPPFIEDAG